MTSLLDQLARTNLSGAPFLLAYGVTWMVCGVLWKKVNPFYASLATLFQGMIALPAALFIMYLIGAFENRPDTGDLNNLIVLIAMSQLLVLPLLIAMFNKRHFSLIPFIFSAAGTVHFLMYTWLYRTISYVVMSVLIAVALAVVYSSDKTKESISSSAAAKACFSTGMILLLNAGYLVLSSN